MVYNWQRLGGRRQTRQRSGARQEQLTATISNMKLRKIGFSRIERLANLFGLYDAYHAFVEKGMLRKKMTSDLYRFGNTSYLIKYFNGYMGHGAITKTGNLGFGFLHAGFINTLNPERVLCIGSRQGFIPAVCALACKYNRHGHVDFVDAGYDAGEPGNWGGTGFWKKNNPHEHFSVLGIGDYLATYVMTSVEYARKYPNRKYTYIYIDGDHSYEGVKKDFNLFWPRLTHGGMMAFHDINTKGAYNDSEFGVWKFWKELKGHHTLEFIDGVNALGVLQK